jgi:hypothetical protein
MISATWIHKKTVKAHPQNNTPILTRKGTVSNEAENEDKKRWKRESGDLVWKHQLSPGRICCTTGEQLSVSQLRNGGMSSAD